jgi:ABC-type antimicrobial peptide transport system permease subunit
VAHAQFPVDVFAVVVRTRRDTAALVEPLRAATAEVDPDLPVFRSRSLAGLESDAVAQPTLYLTLLGLFAAVAILLAAIGVYGVIAQNVASRRREIGIRLALGADRQGVVRLVIRNALVLAGVGVAGGWAMAYLARTVVGRLLYGVAATDTATYLIVGLISILVAVAAAWLPAQRAARVDPATTRRAD